MMRSSQKTDTIVIKNGPVSLRLKKKWVKKSKLQRNMQSEFPFQEKKSYTYLPL